MPDSLNVIALISGGKDSLFSILHCIQNGHKVIALANLYPPTPLTSTHNESSKSETDTTETETADLNSFMYQTVGHSLIPLYSSALQLPLYRRPILGSCIQQSQHYDTSTQSYRSDNASASDETEDLVPLLRQVMSAHPEADAVSTGAILSTYQRTRVESIAIRLGLIPLSYLWQYPVLPPPDDLSNTIFQSSKHRSDGLTGLLEDMRASGLDARIIKIASAGISEKLLFANVANAHTQSRLIDGLSPFFEDEDEIGLRGAVLGEGGEYETIALNGPAKVWSGGRIVIDENNNGSHTEEGVTYLTFGKAELVPHKIEMSSDQGEEKQSKDNLVPVPTMFDLRFVHIKREIDTPQSPINGSQNIQNATAGSIEQQYELGPRQTLLHVSCTVTPNALTISNLTAASTYTYLEGIPVQVSASQTRRSSPDFNQMTVASQLEAILNRLSAILANLSQTHNLPLISTMNISSTTLLLSSMSNFALINPIYARMYPPGLPNPPSRVTIATLLPRGTDISLSLTFDLCTSDQRRGLHVQGRSYWAPANIGPYSQAIAVPLFGKRPQAIEVNADEADYDHDSDDTSRGQLEVVYVAGQIPLIPSSMDVHPGPFSDSSILSLQHLWRIGQERKVDIWPWGVAYLAEDLKRTALERAAIAAEAWKYGHLKPTWSSDLEAEDNMMDRSPDDQEDSSSTIDIWDIQRNRSGYSGFRKSNMTIGKHLHILPNHSLFSQVSNHESKCVPPFIAAEVIALPRNVNIEWWSNGIAGLARKSYSKKSSQLEWNSKVLEWGNLSCLTIIPNTAQSTESVKFIVCLVKEASVQPTSQPTNPPIPVTLSDLLQLLNHDTTSSIHAELVQGTTFTSSEATVQSTQYQSQPAGFTTTPSQSTTIIPCHSIHAHGALTYSNPSPTTAQAGQKQDTDPSNTRSAPSSTGSQTELKTSIEKLSSAILLRVNTY